MSLKLLWRLMLVGQSVYADSGWTSERKGGPPSPLHSSVTGEKKHLVTPYVSMQTLPQLTVKLAVKRQARPNGIKGENAARFFVEVCPKITPNCFIYSLEQILVHLTTRKYIL